MTDFNVCYKLITNKKYIVCKISFFCLTRFIVDHFELNDIKIFFFIVINYNKHKYLGKNIL